MALSSLNFSVNFKNLNTLSDIFQEYGFVSIDKVFDNDEIDEMQNESLKIIDNFDPDDHPKTIFTTSDDQQVIIYLKNINKVT